MVWLVWWNGVGEGGIVVVGRQGVMEREEGSLRPRWGVMEVEDWADIAL